MRSAILAGLVFVAGCGGSESAEGMIGRAVMVVPNERNPKPGIVFALPVSAGTDGSAVIACEAFRGVILGELPETYYEGKLDDFAKWVVRAEDGPAAGVVVTVRKPCVDLVRVK